MDEGENIMCMQKEHWNSVYKKSTLQKPKYDLWLNQFSDILDRSKDTPVIDLGCGLGNNSLYLSERDYRVISCDISEVAIECIKQYVPTLETRVMDILQGLPFPDSSTKVVIADLCLHYFFWKDTMYIVNEIMRVLMPQGYLLCRLNSTKDINHGAGQGEFIEENYYAVDGDRKRFFDREQIERLFNGWQIQNINECQMNRYKLPKILWEVAVAK
jgi:SAM-dependent methyltransferase